MGNARLFRILFCAMCHTARLSATLHPKLQYAALFRPSCPLQPRKPRSISPRIRRVGGVVTQRIANPCTGVRFSYSPPIFSMTYPIFVILLGAGLHLVRRTFVTCAAILGSPMQSSKVCSNTFSGEASYPTNGCRAGITLICPFLSYGCMYSVVGKDFRSLL